MVATLPAAAGNADDAAEAAALRIDVRLLTLSVETLTDERDHLLEERAALELRIADLEAALAPSLAGATATSEDEDVDGAAEDIPEDVTQHRSSPTAPTATTAATSARSKKRRRHCG